MRREPVGRSSNDLQALWKERVGGFLLDHVGPLSSQLQLRGPVPFVPVSDAPAMTCCGGADEIRWVISATRLRPWWTPVDPPFFSKPQGVLRINMINSSRIKHGEIEMRYCIVNLDECMWMWILLILPNLTLMISWITLGPTNLRIVRVLQLAGSVLRLMIGRLFHWKSSPEDELNMNLKPRNTSNKSDEVTKTAELTPQLFEMKMITSSRNFMSRLWWHFLREIEHC